MEAEHCSNACCEVFFTTSHGKTTTPKAEWALVVANDQVHADMQRNRRFPDIDILEQSELSRQAGIRRFEIIAVILYTGPMVYRIVKFQNFFDC